MEQSIKPDPKYFSKSIWILLTVCGIFVLIGAILTLIFFLTPVEPIAIPITWICVAGSIVLSWVISYPIIVYWIRNLEYVIYEDRVCIHKGILTKTVQNIPFRAITDFALVRTLYDRALGIGSIKIQTAGKSMQSGSQYEGSLSGILDYESLHTDLRSKVKILHPMSDSATTAESVKQTVESVQQTPESTLEEILREVKEIRRTVSSRQ